MRRRIAVPSGAAEPASIAASKVLVVTANAAVLYIASHALRKEAFGVFSTVLGGSVLLGRALLLGTEYGYTRLRIASKGNDERKLAGAAISVVAVGALVLSAVCVTAWSLGSADASAAASLTLASIGWACTELAYWVFLAQSRAVPALLAQAGTILARAAAVAAAALLSADSPPLLLTYAVTGFLVGSFALLQAGRAHARRSSMTTAITLLRYSAWQGLAQIVATLSIWFGSFALVLAGWPVAGGRFSLAVTVTSGVSTLTYGLTEHLMVRLADVQIGQFETFLRKAFGKAAAAVAASAAALGIISVACQWIFPRDLWVSAVYLPLAASVLLNILYAPFEAAAHYMLAPRIPFVARLIRLCCTLAAGVPLALQGNAVLLAWLQAGSALAGLSYLGAAVRVQGRRRALW